MSKRELDEITEVMNMVEESLAMLESEEEEAQNPSGTDDPDSENFDPYADLDDDRLDDAKLQKDIDDAFAEVERKRRAGQTLDEIVATARSETLLYKEPVQDRVQVAVYNLSTFDMPRFREWLLHQSAQIKASAATCPPNRLYMHEDGVLCSIYGYARYTGRLILKTVEIDGEIRDVRLDQVKDVTKELLQKYGISLPGF